MLTPTELTVVGFTIVLSKFFVLFCVYLFCSFALTVQEQSNPESRTGF